MAAIAFFATRDSGGGSKAATNTTTTTTRPRSTTTTTTTTTPASGNGTELITNDGGQLQVTVPEVWSQRNPAKTADGFPELVASTNLTEFLATTFAEPGVDFVAFPATTIDPSDLDAALDKIVDLDRGGQNLGTLCTRGTRTDFTPNGSGLSTGRQEVLTGCGGGGDVIIMAATNADSRSRHSSRCTSASRPTKTAPTG